MKINKKYLNEFIREKDDIVKYDLFLTLPLRKKSVVIKNKKSSHLQKSFHKMTDIDLSNLLSRFIVNLNRKIFTRRELNDPNSPSMIQFIPVREHDETCVHIIAKCPTSRKLPDDCFKYMRFKKILIQEIRRMKLFEPNQVSKTRHYFDCKKKNKNKINKKTECEIIENNFDYLFNFYKKISTNAVDLMNYTSKKENDDDVNIDIIDFNNMRVAT